MLKKKRVLKIFLSVVFCFAIFAANLVNVGGKTTAFASEIPQTDVGILEDGPQPGEKWDYQDGVLSLNGVNWSGSLNLLPTTQIELQNSTTNTIVGLDGVAIVLNGDATITGEGKLILGKLDTAVERLINFDNGDLVSFSGTCKVQRGAEGEPETLDGVTELTSDILDGVNYVEITTSDYSESGAPEGGDSGDEPEGSEPEGGDPIVETPSITAVSEMVTIQYSELVDGKYNVSELFNPVNCESVDLVYYLVSEDEQTETPLGEDYDSYKIDAAGTYTFKVKALDSGDDILAECTAKLKVELLKPTLSLAFGIWEYGDEPTPQITGTVPAGANVTYRYYKDPEHEVAVIENGGIPAEPGIYYAVAHISSTPTSEELEIEASFEIIPKTITIVWSADNYTYNGEVQEVAAHYVAGGDNIPLDVTLDKEFKDAQSYTATAAFKTSDPHYYYVLPDNPTNTYTIKQRKITVKIDNKTTIYMQDLSTLTAKVSGDELVPGEKPYTLSTLASKDVMGEYQITGDITNDNYDITFINGKYIVKNAITDVSISGWNYNESPNTPTATAHYGNELITFRYVSTNGYDSNIAPTEPGTYYVWAEIIVPEEYYCASGNTYFRINKLLVDEPVRDQTTYTYDGQYKIYNLDGQNTLYTVTGAVRAEAGHHIVKVTLKEPAHYRWKTTDNATLEYAFVINKAKVQKPEKDTRVFKYSGFNLTYGVSENAAYKVSGNIQSEIGTHIVTIELVDKKNTCWSDGSSKDLKYEFVIRGSNIDNPITTNPKGETVLGKPVTIIGSDGTGIEPGATLNVVVDDAKDKKEVENLREQLKEHIEKYDAIHTIYGVTLTKENIEIQPNGTITLKMLVPEELREINFKLFHIHEDALGNISVEELACSVSNSGYVTIQVDKLSDFVFVYKQNSLSLLIIIFACVSFVLAVALAIQLYLYFKNKGNGGKKASSTSLALAPAMFVGGEIALSIILGVLAVLLLAGNVLLFILLLKIRIANKKKAKEVTAVDMSKKATQERLEEKQRAVATEKQKTPKAKLEKKPAEKTSKKSEIQSKSKTPKTKKTASDAKSGKKEKVEMRSLDFTKKK